MVAEVEKDESVAVTDPFALSGEFGIIGGRPCSLISRM